MNQVEYESVSVVRAARNGDQNAMDVLRQIGINAKKGDAKARQSYDYIAKYIKSNPVQNDNEIPNLQLPVKNDFSAEAAYTCGVLMTCDDADLPIWIADIDRLAGFVGLITATTILGQSNKAMTNERIQRIADGLNDQSKSLFLWGVCHCKDEGEATKQLMMQPSEVKGIALAGKVIGQAQLLQMVIHGAPLKKLSDEMAYEFGE
jgi:hypothetical protein